jgi:ribosome-binding factor A
MPREFHRSRRVEEQLQRLLSELVRREVRDPRVGPITITAVEVSRDLTHAKVYFLPFDPARKAVDVGHALASAAPYLRVLLRQHLKMRQVPELHFLPDETIERAAHLSALIKEAVASDAARAAQAGPAEPAEPGAEGDRPGPGEGGEREE